MQSLLLDGALALLVGLSPAGSSAPTDAVPAATSGPPRADTSPERPTTGPPAEPTKARQQRRHRRLGAGLLGGGIVVGTLGATTSTIFALSLSGHASCESECGGAVGVYVSMLPNVVLLPGANIMLALSSSHRNQARLLRGTVIDRRRLRRRRSGAIAMLGLGTAGFIGGLTLALTSAEWTHIPSAVVFTTSHLLRWAGVSELIAVDTLRRAPSTIKIQPVAYATPQAGTYGGLSVQGRF